MLWKDIFCRIFKLCLATVGVCVFYAFTSVGAFFYLENSSLPKEDFAYKQPPLPKGNYADALPIADTARRN